MPRDWSDRQGSPSSSGTALPTYHLHRPFLNIQTDASQIYDNLDKYVSESILQWVYNGFKTGL